MQYRVMGPEGLERENVNAAELVQMCKIWEIDSERVEVEITINWEPDAIYAEQILEAYRRARAGYNFNTRIVINRPVGDKYKKIVIEDTWEQPR